MFGPWTANIGRNGVAPPGEKREGDGRTPSGTYGFDFMFGTNPNPGVKFPFRTITGTNIVWDDDSASRQLQPLDRHQHRVGRYESGADVRERLRLGRGDRLQQRAHAGSRQRDLPASGDPAVPPRAASRCRKTSCSRSCAGSTPPANPASPSARSKRSCHKSKALGSPDGGGRSDQPTTRATTPARGATGRCGRTAPVLPDSRRCQAGRIRHMTSSSAIVFGRQQDVRIQTTVGIERALDRPERVDLGR